MRYLLFTCCLFSYAKTIEQTQEIPHLKKSVEVLFAPQDNCTKAIIELINNTNHSIKIHAYAFTSDEIIEALERAAKRGVKVRILADKTYINKIGMNRLKGTQGVKSWNDSKPRIAHNKIIICKNKKDTSLFATAVVTGSFNFSRSAQHCNAENIVIFKNHNRIYSKYHANWKYRKNLKETVFSSFDPNMQATSKISRRSMIRR